MSKLIVNCETGETVERELNAEELAQQATEEAAVQAAEAARQAEAATKAAQRQALLNRLGITEEEARILLGGN
jgi:acyl-CoA reductase-like NAD-dependent aldehyde dehydrogenase